MSASCVEELAAIHFRPEFSGSPPTTALFGLRPSSLRNRILLYTAWPRFSLNPTLSLGERVRRKSAGCRGSGVLCLLAVLAGLLLLTSGCQAPVGAQKTSPALVYRQNHENALSGSGLSRETQSVLRRFDQEQPFAKDPDAAIRFIHQKAVESGEHHLLFALSELNYRAGERIRRSVKPWDLRDARDYYLASAVYAWFFLFEEGKWADQESFDPRFRTACNFYNSGLSWALTESRSTNAIAVLEGGVRHLPVGQIELKFSQQDFPWPLSEFQQFLVADQFLVRGLSMRNGQPGLGAPLVGVSGSGRAAGVSRTVPATALLRLSGKVKDLAEGHCRGSLELYSSFYKTVVKVGDRSVPLETDTTLPLAYSLNQTLLWRLGMMQFLSGEERIPTGVYSPQPWQTGQIPVVFVHGTFSSPVWWAEMINTLSGDPELQKRYQFWFFIYNSGNPMAYSASKLRESLTAKIRELDPTGQDPALRQMVVIGHSQGGLLTKLTATDTGDKLLETVLKTNRLDSLGLSVEQQQLIRRYACYEKLPFVSRVVFISAPHHGSYLASSLARRLARKLVSLPSKLLSETKQISGMAEKLNFPRELKGTPTSLDGMSPKNPFLLALAEIPIAPGVKGHSIIPVKGEGDYHEGKDGLVTYQSAHVDYVESEFIVRSPHSCQDKPATIEEVRRILLEHLASLPPSTNAPPLAR